MSSFGARRQARVISVEEEEDAGISGDQSQSSAPIDSETLRPFFNTKSGRKGLRQSGLRKAIHIDDSATSTAEIRNDGAPDDQDSGPAVIRPKVNRAGSSKTRKASKLSFDDDGADSGEGGDMTVKQPSMGKKAIENSASKRLLGTLGLPLRTFGDDEDRPKYSKEYLAELQSSTPNTPINVGSHTPDEDEMILDASELDGALIVDNPQPPTENPQTSILTDAEIRERKERRARLAKEENFLSLEDEGDDELRTSKKKEETRLVAEDEELGEGFEELVEDGGLSLGKKATKERHKRERRQMAEMITQAEGHSSDDSSDSDAERRIAYEAAQTKAGMDGLKKPKNTNTTDDSLQIPSKITPLPSLAECLLKLRTSLKSMEEELKTKKFRVEQLRHEKTEIGRRESEVQALLDETGNKYREAMDHNNAMAKSVAPGTEVTGERGLDSLGTTPQPQANGTNVLL